MSSTQYVQHAPSPVRVVVPAWAWVMLFVALGTLYLITQDNGAFLAQLGDGAHEFFHDARHSLGVPCH